MNACAVCLDVHRHRGDAEGAALVGGHHVNHHKYADRDGDPHSPMISGFYYAHIGWFLNDTKHDKLEPNNPVIRDFGKVPEIAWLERFFFVPPLVLALTLFFAGGMPWLVYGFCLPTMTLAHATFAINTDQPHVRTRRFETVDESRNNPFTAFFAAARGGTTTTTATSARRATASTGGSSNRRGG
jgi:stearoyl-CoA desaturase (delta-9 desaturase)